MKTTPLTVHKSGARLTPHTSVSVDEVANQFGATPEQVRKQYAKNALQLEGMAAQAEKAPGKMFRGYPAEYWRQKAAEYRQKGTAPHTSAGEVTELPIPSDAEPRDLALWTSLKGSPTAAIVRHLQGNDPNGTYRMVDDVVADGRKRWVDVYDSDPDEPVGRVIASTLWDDVTPFTDTPAGRRLALAYAYDLAFGGTNSYPGGFQKAFETERDAADDANRKEVNNLADAYRAGTLK